MQYLESPDVIVVLVVAALLCVIALTLSRRAALRRPHAGSISFRNTDNMSSRRHRSRSRCYRLIRRWFPCCCCDSDDEQDSIPFRRAPTPMPSIVVAESPTFEARRDNGWSQGTGIHGKGSLSITPSRVSSGRKSVGGPSVKETGDCESWKTNASGVMHKCESSSVDIFYSGGEESVSSSMQYQDYADVKENKNELKQIPGYVTQTEIVLLDDCNHGVQLKSQINEIEDPCPVIETLDKSTETEGIENWIDEMPIIGRNYESSDTEKIEKASSVVETPVLSVTSQSEYGQDKATSRRTQGVRKSKLDGSKCKCQDEKHKEIHLPGRENFKKDIETKSTEKSIDEKPVRLRGQEPTEYGEEIICHDVSGEALASFQSCDEFFKNKSTSEWVHEARKAKFDEAILDEEQLIRHVMKKRYLLRRNEAWYTPRENASDTPATAIAGYNNSRRHMKKGALADNYRGPILKGISENYSLHLKTSPQIEEIIPSGNSEVKIEDTKNLKHSAVGITNKNSHAPETDFHFKIAAPILKLRERNSIARNEPHQLGIDRNSAADTNEGMQVNPAEMKNEDRNKHKRDNGNEIVEKKAMKPPRAQCKRRQQYKEECTKNGTKSDGNGSHAQHRKNGNNLEAKCNPKYNENFIPVSSPTKLYEFKTARKYLGENAVKEDFELPETDKEPALTADEQHKDKKPTYKNRGCEIIATSVEKPAVISKIPIINSGNMKVVKGTPSEKDAKFRSNASTLKDDVIVEGTRITGRFGENDKLEVETGSKGNENAVKKLKKAKRMPTKDLREIKKSDISI